MKLLLAVGLGVFCCAAQAADTASTVRPTDLKAKPFVDADTLATLSVGQKVDVLLREASWYQVKTQGPTGWVKMLTLRFPTVVGKSSDSASDFLGAAIGSNRGTTTTGAKGLTKEDLQGAQPNPEALKVASTYATSIADAQQFAKAGKLVAQHVSYLGEGEKK